MMDGVNAAWMMMEVWVEASPFVHGPGVIEERQVLAGHDHVVVN